MASRHGRKFQVTVGLNLQQIEYVEQRAEQDGSNMVDVLRRAVDMLMKLEPVKEPAETAAAS